MAKDQLVELKNVSKIYQMGEVRIEALQDINLGIKQGEFIVVLGPSGSGKTTLLNLMGGLDAPTNGQIIIDKQDIARLSEKELTSFRGNKIGFIFQFFNLIPTLSAQENVELALEIASRSQESKPKRSAKELLSMVGLTKRLDHFPYQLSGGEQQRVAIARALAKDPPLMLCDEPTGELDFRTGKKILEVMIDLNKSEGKTFILVTHNAVVGKIAQTVLHLHDGRIAQREENKKPIKPAEIEW